MEITLVFVNGNYVGLGQWKLRWFLSVEITLVFVNGNYVGFSVNGNYVGFCQCHWCAVKVIYRRIVFALSPFRSTRNWESENI